MHLQEGASLCLRLQGPGGKACSPKTESDAFLSHFTSGSAFPSQTDSLGSPSRSIPALQGSPAGLGRGRLISRWARAPGRDPEGAVLVLKPDPRGPPQPRPVPFAS